MPRRSSAAVPAIMAAVTALAAVPILLVTLSRPASAVVVRRTGFSATVAGWRSWYGSYGMAGIGDAWCVDHGIPAPDAAYDYGPAVLGERAVATRTAIAWALGRHGRDAGPVDAAALELVLHDLMGARYPTGVLSVDRLRPADLAGFAGHEAEVLARAQQLRADAIVHSRLVPPLTLAVSAPAVAAGAPAAVHVAVTDAAGRGVDGISVAVAGTTATTAADGRASVTVPAVDGDNMFEATAVVPDLVLQSFAPRRAVAQRVARTAALTLRAGTGFAAVPLRHLTIHKIGDDTAYLGLGGAHFSVAGHDLVTDGAGMTAPVELPAGRYNVTETAAPAGYAIAGPWTVDLTGGDVTLDAEDRAVPGAMSISKVDAVTGTGVAGAQLSIAYDTDRDGTFETAIADVTSTTEAVPKVGLRPGDYRVTETAAPDGYRPAPAPVLVTVAPGKTEPVVIRDTPVATMAFAKTPAVAGAVFAVRPEPTAGPGETTSAGAEVGRCTTDATGRCSLPPAALDGGARYCWSEVQAPPGFAPAAGSCVTAGGAGSTTTVAVAEPVLAAAPPPPPAAPAPAPAAPTVARTPVPIGQLPATGTGLAGEALTGLALSLAGAVLVRWSRRPSPA